MSDYRVNLDIYNGPLDLLLYLIRRDEVDIYDIPIARITEQYIQYVELLKKLDPNLAGEFLVMAATLMEIKTRMLLPATAAAEDLREAHEVQSLKFPRQAKTDLGDEKEIDLDQVQVWDLLDAFNSVLKAIGVGPGYQEIIYDDTPLELHAADIIDRLSREGAITFAKIFEGRTARSEIVGLFLALLELIRRGQVLASQAGIFGEISVQLNPNPPATADQAETNDSREPEQPAAGNEGQYVSEDSTGRTDDQPGTEDQAAGN